MRANRLRSLGALSLAAIVAAVACAQEIGPAGFGRPATQADEAALRPVVFPDGRGLPAGRGSVQEGQTIYARECSACHGQRGEGGPYEPIAGGIGSLATDRALPTVGSYWPYATTIWDYIQRTMPFQTPGKLSDNETYAVTAYVLFLNQIVEQDFIADQRSLHKVEMPNRDGFVPDPRPEFPPHSLQSNLPPSPPANAPR